MKDRPRPSQTTFCPSGGRGRKKSASNWGYCLEISCRFYIDFRKRVSWQATSRIERTRQCKMLWDSFPVEYQHNPLRTSRWVRARIACVWSSSECSRKISRFLNLILNQRGILEQILCFLLLCACCFCSSLGLNKMYSYNIMLHLK